MRRIIFTTLLFVFFLSGCSRQNGSSDFFTLAGRMGIDIYYSTRLLDLSRGTLLVLNNSCWTNLSPEDRKKCRYFAAHEGTVFFSEPSDNTGAINYCPVRRTQDRSFRILRYQPDRQYRNFLYTTNRVLSPPVHFRILAGNRDGGLFVERLSGMHLLVALSPETLSGKGLKTRSLPLMLMRFLYRKKISRIIVLQLLNNNGGTNSGGIFEILFKVPVLILLHFAFLFLVYALYRGKRFGPGLPAGRQRTQEYLPVIAGFLKKGGDLTLAVRVEREYTKQVVLRAFACFGNDEQVIREQLTRLGIPVGECVMLFGDKLPGHKQDLSRMLQVFRKIRKIIDNNTSAKGKR